MRRDILLISREQNLDIVVVVKRFVKITSCKT